MSGEHAAAQDELATAQADLAKVHDEHIAGLQKLRKVQAAEVAAMEENIAAAVTASVQAETRQWLQNVQTLR